MEEVVSHSGGRNDGLLHAVGFTTSSSGGSSSTLNNVKCLDYGRHMLDAQRFCYTHSTMTDVSVVAGTKRIRAHQLVLSASSEFFCSMLAASGAGPVATVGPTGGQLNLTDAPTIVLADIDPDLLEPLMSFIYTGSTAVHPTMLSEFMELCKFLQIKGLLNYACMLNGIQLQMHDIQQQLSATDSAEHPVTLATTTQTQTRHTFHSPTAVNDDTGVALELYEELPIQADGMDDGQQYVIHTYVDGVGETLTESAEVDAHDGGASTMTTLDTFEDYLDDDDVELDDSAAHQHETTETDADGWIDAPVTFIVPGQVPGADEPTETTSADQLANVVQPVKRPARHKPAKATAKESHNSLNPSAIPAVAGVADAAAGTTTDASSTAATSGGRLVKSYSDATLAEAMAALETGSSVVEVAARFDIPRSTIYARIRCGRDRVYRQYQQTKLDDAVRFVVETGNSLKEASQRYDVSKTVLWRALKKSAVYRPEDRIQLTRADALKAIQRGETLISISKAYRIPLATLHRDKVRLYREGKLPDHCVLRKRDMGHGYRNRLDAAVKDCRNGMPQKTASELHGVPKTTIWRHLHRARRLAASSGGGDGDGVDAEKVLLKSVKVERGEDEDDDELLEEDEYEMDEDEEENGEAEEEDDVYEEELAELEGDELVDGEPVAADSHCLQEASQWTRNR